GARAAAGPRRAWSLPDHAEELVGLFIAPPVCVLAVTARAGRGGAVRAGAATATGRLFGQEREAPHVLAVACAFAALRGERHTPDTPWADHRDLRAFLDQVRSATGAGAIVHLLAHGVPAQVRGALDRPDTAVPPRLRWHRAPSPA